MDRFADMPPEMKKRLNYWVSRRQSARTHADRQMYAHEANKIKRAWKERMK